MSKVSTEIHEALLSIDDHIDAASEANGDHRVFVNEICEGMKIVQWARTRSGKMKAGLFADGISALINEREEALKAALCRAISDN